MSKSHKNVIFNQKRTKNTKITQVLNKKRFSQKNVLEKCLEKVRFLP